MGNVWLAVVVQMSMVHIVLLAMVVQMSMVRSVLLDVVVQCQRCKPTEARLGLDDYTL